mgnify:FL=1
MNPDKEYKSRGVSTRRDFVFRKLTAVGAGLLLAACEPYPVTYQNEVTREKAMARLKELGMLGELNIVSLKSVLGPDSSDLAIILQNQDQFLGFGGKGKEFLQFAWEDNTPEKRLAVSKLPMSGIKFVKSEKEDAKPTFHLEGVDLRGAYKSPDPKDLSFVYTAVFSLPPKMSPTRRS